MLRRVGRRCDGDFRQAPLFDHGVRLLWRILFTDGVLK